MDIVLCESSTKEKYNAAKARRDVKQIVAQMGYREIDLFHAGRWKPLILCEMIFSCIKTMFIAGKGDNVFIQYPYYPKAVNQLFLFLLSFGKKIKKYSVTMLIHDVLTLRQRVTHPDDELKLLAAEVQTWAWADRVICHNESMLATLKKAHPYDHYVALGMFDYLYDGPVCERVYHEHATVMIAGYLGKDKCAYLYKLDEVENVKFDLFGTNYTGIETDQIKYRGQFRADELIPHLDGQYGLVWDGDSIETCAGDTGEYLKYNNPHKFSLYIAAGVPVIVWNESALAEVVRKQQIGIAVRSLKELQAKLDEIDAAKYGEMVRNVMCIRTDIVQGKQLKSAIERP